MFETWEIGFFQKKSKKEDSYKCSLFSRLRDILKEPFFWMSNAIGWTNPRKLSCVCRMITRVCALESLWSKLTSEYPSYGLATSRKFSAGVWNFVRRKLGVSKTAKNHRFQTLRRYIGKNRRFLQLKHKNGAAQATMKTPSDELR